VTGLKIAVVGGGLAGLAAAIECADGGADVTLYEARQRLGGATFSVERNGHWIDNGQHVLLRCCTAYRGFLARLGVEHLVPIQPRLRIPVLRENKPPAFLSRAPLPAPLHLVPTLLRYSTLRTRDRLNALLAAAALLQARSRGRATRPEDVRGMARRAQPVRRRGRRALNLITLPTLTCPRPRDRSRSATMVFRTGLLDAADACDIGIPAVTLQRLHGDAAAAALHRTGVRVELGTQLRV
jgi:uncharacterized protein with NAD-binding domain and iron-sulfur cluster